MQHVGRCNVELVRDLDHIMRSREHAYLHIIFSACIQFCFSCAYRNLTRTTRHSSFPRTNIASIDRRTNRPPIISFVSSKCFFWGGGGGGVILRRLFFQAPQTISPISWTHAVPPPPFEYLLQGRRSLLPYSRHRTSARKIVEWDGF